MFSENASNLSFGDDVYYVYHVFILIYSSSSEDGF